MKRINDEALLERIGFKPHKGQIPIIEAIKDPKIRDFVLVCGRRFGKALDIKTPILTTSGWKTMKDIKEGDYVFGDDGKPTKVVFVTEIMENHKCYEITFSDGYKIIADAEHQWTVEDKSFRKNYARTKNTSCKIVTKTTEELAKDFKILRKDGKVESNYSIPNCKPLEYEEKELLVNPYVLGSWLGDGTSSGSGFTTNDKETVDIFNNHDYELLKCNHKYAYRICDNNVIFTKKRTTKRGIFVQKLRKYNLINNKHIPEIYKRGSYNQRLELLQGLMDTDGYCGTNGNCEYCGTDKKLVEDVYEIIISLGIKAVWCEGNSSLNGKIFGKKYRINFTTDLPIFKLKRKLDRLLSKKRKNDTKRRFIKNIIEVDSVPVKCISVDNKNHLYLAGKNLIATHNTFVAAYAAFRELLKPNRNIWIVAPTSDLTQKTFSYVLRFLSKIYEPGEFSIKTKPYTKLRMANGAWLECKTADNPVSLIGEELDLLIIDEAARIAPMIYERELAATTMSRKGRTIFISSPKRKNWFYNKYKSIEKSENGFVWNAPSSDNPKNSPEELERIKNTLPEAVWKQEFLAQFVDSGAEVFRNIREIVLDKELCYEEPIPTHRYILGVDIAKLNDWTVLTMLDKQSHKVVAWDRFQRVDYPIQNNRIASLAKKYNNARIILDSTGGGKVLNDFLTREEGLIIDDFNFSNKSKINLIDKLGQYIENKSVFIPNEPVIINELEVFGLDYTDGGTLIYSAPVGMNDDCVCSLALAVWGLNSTKVRREAPPYIGAKKEERKIEKIKKKKIHR